uniref:Uncharacterized protein n=1 Tax=Romanomermis culicivorax TaxID=13658 RepID=A0A915HYM5_ROMCU
FNALATSIWEEQFHNSENLQQIVFLFENANQTIVYFEMTDTTRIKKAVSYNPQTSPKKRSNESPIML